MVERSSQGDRDALEHIRWKDNDDKKHFKIVVYGQRKPNQNAERQTQLAIRRIICGHAKTKYVPV
jgi:hypothetical protein